MVMTLTIHGEYNDRKYSVCKTNERCEKTEKKGQTLQKYQLTVSLYDNGRGSCDGKSNAELLDLSLSDISLSFSLEDEHLFSRGNDLWIDDELFPCSCSAALLSVGEDFTTNSGLFVSVTSSGNDRSPLMKSVSFVSGLGRF